MKKGWFKWWQLLFLCPSWGPVRLHIEDVRATGSSTHVTMCSLPGDSSWNTCVLSKTECSDGQDREYVVLEWYRIRFLWASGHNIAVHQSLSNLFLHCFCFQTPYLTADSLTRRSLSVYHNSCWKQAGLMYVLCLRYIAASPVWGKQKALSATLRSHLMSKTDNRKAPKQGESCL